MRLVKSPASPTINQLGFREVGKSGVAFSRRVSGCLFKTYGTGDTNALDNSHTRGNLHRTRNQRLPAGRVLIQDSPH